LSHGVCYFSYIGVARPCKSHEPAKEEDDPEIVEKSAKQKRLENRRITRRILDTIIAVRRNSAINAGTPTDVLVIDDDDDDDVSLTAKSASNTTSGDGLREVSSSLPGQSTNNSNSPDCVAEVYAKSNVNNSTNGALDAAVELGAPGGDEREQNETNHNSRSTKRSIDFVSLDVDPEGASDVCSNKKSSGSPSLRNRFDNIIESVVIESPAQSGELFVGEFSGSVRTSVCDRETAISDDRTACRLTESEGNSNKQSGNNLHKKKTGTLHSITTELAESVQSGEEIDNVMPETTRVVEMVPLPTSDSVINLECPNSTSSHCSHGLLKVSLRQQNLVIPEKFKLRNQQFFSKYKPDMNRSVRDEQQRTVEPPRSDVDSTSVSVTVVTLKSRSMDTDKNCGNSSGIFELAEECNVLNNTAGCSDIHMETSSVLVAENDSSLVLVSDKEAPNSAEINETARATRVASPIYPLKKCSEDVLANSMTILPTESFINSRVNETKGPAYVNISNVIVIEPAEDEMSVTEEIQEDRQQFERSSVNTSDRDKSGSEDVRIVGDGLNNDIARLVQGDSMLNSSKGVSNNCATGSDNCADDQSNSQLATAQLPQNSFIIPEAFKTRNQLLFSGIIASTGRSGWSDPISSASDTILVDSSDSETSLKNNVTDNRAELDSD